MMRRPYAARDVERFNAEFAVGEPVLYIAEHGAPAVRDRIFAPAELLPNGKPVAWLAGQRDAVSINLVAKAPDSAEVRHAA